MTREIRLKCHSQGTVTFTPVAELLAEEVSRLFFTTSVSRGQEMNSQSSAFEANALWPTIILSGITIPVYLLFLAFKSYTQGLVYVPYVVYQNVGSLQRHKNVEGHIIKDRVGSKKLIVNLTRKRA
mgnify:CR=1 FL=1